MGQLGVDEHRGRGRDDRRRHRGLHRPHGLGALLGSRRPGEHHRHLAVHGVTNPFGVCRSPSPEGGGGELLATRPLRGQRVVAQPLHGPSAANEPARHRSYHLEPARHAGPWGRQAPPRRSPRLRSHRRGEGTQNILCACLAAAVLVGLMANARLGWWWLDPLVAWSSQGSRSRKGGPLGAAMAPAADSPSKGEPKSLRPGGPKTS